MKTVFKTLSFVALLGVSAASQAKIIEVKYQGVVDTIHAGSTYSLGQLISGSLRIDTSKAPANTFAAPEAFYGNTGLGGGDSGFVTGFAQSDPLFPDSFDYVYLLDDTGGAGDDFQVGDDELIDNDDGNGNYDGVFSYVFFGLENPTPIDFISGTGLEQVFSLSSAQTSMTGFLYNERWKTVNFVDQYYDVDTIDFSLTSLSAAVVPEPGSIALLGLGLAGLLASRRRTSAV